MTIVSGRGGREWLGGYQRHVKINIDKVVILLIKNYRSVSDVSSERGLEFGTSHVRTYTLYIVYSEQIMSNNFRFS